jgi:hypothetical protein
MILIIRSPPKEEHLKNYLWHIKCVEDLDILWEPYGPFIREIFLIHFCSNNLKAFSLFLSNHVYKDMICLFLNLMPFLESTKIIEYIWFWDFWRRFPARFWSLRINKRMIMFQWMNDSVKQKSNETIFDFGNIEGANLNIKF